MLLIKVLRCVVTPILVCKFNGSDSSFFLRLLIDLVSNILDGVNTSPVNLHLYFDWKHLLKLYIFHYIIEYTRYIINTFDYTGFYLSSNVIWYH